MSPDAAPPAAEPHPHAAGDVGFVHSHDNASAVDGPGLRYVVWLMGCHLRCQYCHNPDTWRLPPNGNRRTPDQVLGGLEPYAAFLRATGGGFTISGGEPLVQAPFALRLLRGAKQKGLHTALDTNGYLGGKLSDADLDDIDLFLLDLKAYGDAHHRRVAGATNQPILEFAERLAERNRPAWVRYVLVPGLTDGRGDMRALARFVGRLPNVQRLEVLPFHQLGKSKWSGLNLEYPLHDTPAATPEQADAAREVFREAGCPVPA